MRICENWRIASHRVFAGEISERLKTSIGWFYGFKLHLVINEKGELLDGALTPGRPMTTNCCESSQSNFTGVSTEIEGPSPKTFTKHFVSKA